MCHPKQCKTCKKITWAGCGQHVADVRASVPADMWCAGHQSTGNDTWLRRALGR